MRKYAVIALKEKMAFDYSTSCYEDVNEAIKECKILNSKGIEAYVYERYYF